MPGVPGKSSGKYLRETRTIERVNLLTLTIPPPLTLTKMLENEYPTPPPEAAHDLIGEPFSVIESDPGKYPSQPLAS